MPLVFTRTHGETVLLFDNTNPGRFIASFEICHDHPKKTRVKIAAGDSVEILRGEITTNHKNEAWYTCMLCGHNHLTDQRGPTFACIKCGAANSWRLKR